jgi:hypothetical protein
MCMPKAKDLDEEDVANSGSCAVTSCSDSDCGTPIRADMCESKM